ncbi:MAG: cupin domain-containing protein [Allomuricauda sp.]
MSITDYITKSKKLNWKPLIENGVHYEGIFVKSLYFDKATNRSKTILLKFEKEASYPYHNHPAGEELMVLEGSCFVNDVMLEKGDYLYTPPNAKHAVKTSEGCIILFMVPEEVEILG